MPDPVSFPRRSGRLFQRPEMFEAWAPGFPRQNGDLAATVDGMVKTYRDFIEGMRKTEANEALTPGARLVRHASAANSKIKSGLEGLNKAIEATNEVAAHLRSETVKAYDPPGKSYEVVLRHQEVRAHAKSLPLKDKMKLFIDAQKAGDEDTLIALASGQAYLSGMPQQQHDEIRNYLIQKHAPDQAAALEALSEQQKYAGMFRDTMLQSVADLVDFQKADKLIAASADDAE